MQATSIRVHGSKPTARQLEAICADLASSFERLGFDAEASLGRSSTSLRIGGHMCQFTIDPAVWGYNANVGWMNGHGDIRDRRWKRSRTPTWDQRVAFNALVNTVLTRHGVTCHLKSGPFVVRTVRDGACTRSDWSTSDAQFGCVIVPLTEEMVAERKAQKRAEAHARRDRLWAQRAVETLNAARMPTHLRLVKEA